MAISFDETDDYYDISDAASLTFPDGDWCIGIWTYVSDNSGSDAQFLLTNNTVAANSSFSLWIEENGEAAEIRDRWSFHAVDDDGTVLGGATLRTGVTGADSKWRLIIAQRDTGANEGQIWFCEPGATASKENSGADTNFAAINGGNWTIGWDVDTTANWQYGSIACEFFKGNFALTQAEITALGAGLPIKTLAKQLSYTLDVYLPMWEADATLLDYSNSGNSGTRHSAPTTSTHAPICTPVKHRRMKG